MHLREALLQSRAEIEEILKRQVWMKASDNVEFGDGFGVSRGCGFESLVERHGVGAGRVFLAPEGAEAAGGDADIRGIDMAIDVEIGFVAMHALTNGIGQPADGEDISGTVKSKGIVDVEASALRDLFGDWVETGFVGLERVRCHLLDDIAGEVTSGRVKRFEPQRS